MSENVPVSEKRPPKPHILTRLLAFLLTAALTIGVLLLVAFRDRLNLDALRRWLAYRSLSTSSTGEAAPFIHAGGDLLSFAYLDSGILTASNVGAHYYSFTGEPFVEEVLSVEHPVLASSASSGVVYDAGGQSLFLFRHGEETFSLALEGGADLLSARVNDSGWLAVTAQQSGFKGAVTVYNASGGEVIQISLSSTFVVDAVLSPDCKTVAVVTIDQEEGQFQSQVRFYPVGQKEPSAVVLLGSCMVLELDYEDGLLWVLGEDRLLTVAPDGSKTDVFPFGRTYLKGCDFGGDGFALLLLGDYRAGSASRALVIGPDCTSSAGLNLNGQVLSFDSAGNYFCLLTGNALTIYTPELEVYTSLNSTQGARYCAMAANGSALLADSQKAWLFIPA